MENKNADSKRTIAILGLLLLIAISTAGYLWKENNTLKETKEDLTNDVFNLEEIRSGLITDIETLQLNYKEVLDSNDSLKIIFVEKVNEVEQKTGGN